MCSPRIIPGDGAYSVCTSHRYWANTLLIELRLAFPLLCSQIQITDNCIYRVAFRIQVSMKQVSLLHLEETQESTLINTTALPLVHVISSHAALSLWVAVLYLCHTPVINISGILSALSRSCIWQCASAVLCLTVYLYCLWYPADPDPAFCLTATNYPIISLLSSFLQWQSPQARSSGMSDAVSCRMGLHSCQCLCIQLPISPVQCLPVTEALMYSLLYGVWLWFAVLQILCDTV